MSSPTKDSLFNELVRLLVVSVRRELTLLFLERPELSVKFSAKSEGAEKTDELPGLAGMEDGTGKM